MSHFPFGMASISNQFHLPAQCVHFEFCWKKMIMMVMMTMINVINYLKRLCPICRIRVYLCRVLADLDIESGRVRHRSWGASWVCFGTRKLTKHCDFPMVFVHFRFISIFDTSSLPWTVLGPSWDLLGSTWDHVGAVLGRLGVVFGPSGSFLGSSWSVLGLSWDHFWAV